MSPVTFNFNEDGVEPHVYVSEHARSATLSQVAENCAVFSHAHDMAAFLHLLKDADLSHEDIGDIVSRATSLIAAIEQTKNAVTANLNEHVEAADDHSISESKRSAPALAAVPIIDYNESVRRAERGIEARRKLGDLRPVIRDSVVAFARSGKQPTKPNVVQFLASRGTFGAVDAEVAEIIKAYPLAKADLESLEVATPLTPVVASAPDSDALPVARTATQSVSAKP